MLVRGSPKLLLQAGSMKKKKRPSPKAGGQAALVEIDIRPRAHWNLGLEKALVEMLHDHNNDCYRGQNGWTTDLWNRIVKLFHAKFKHVLFSKQQIQYKEKELKREYKMLKEARKQSGASWDEKLCMIVADEAVWENIITSYPKAKKFKSKPFPLFETLGELYDGHTAEGSLNFTSLPETTQDDDGFEAEEFQSTEVHLHDDDDDDVRILDQPIRPTTARKEDGSAVPDGGKKVRKSQKEAPAPKHFSKKQKKQDVTHMMSRYLEVKTKQVECEAADKAKAGSEADEYSIKNCISVIKTMEELTGEEKAEAVDLFKDAQNREIFMSVDSATRLIWIRKKCMQTQGN